MIDVVIGSVVDDMYSSGSAGHIRIIDESHIVLPSTASPS